MTQISETELNELHADKARLDFLENIRNQRVGCSLVGDPRRVRLKIYTSVHAFNEVIKPTFREVLDEAIQTKRLEE